MVEGITVWIGLVAVLIGIIGFVFKPINSKLKILTDMFDRYQDKQQSLEVRVGILETRYDNLEKILHEIKSDVEYIKKNIK